MTTAVYIGEMSSPRRDYLGTEQPIMQNKPNFLKYQMNINLIMTMLYGNFHLLGRSKNKPNSNPIKPNLRKAKMNVNSVKTKDYRNEPPLPSSAKQTQFQRQKNASVLLKLRPCKLHTTNDKPQFPTPVILSSGLPRKTKRFIPRLPET